MASVLVFEPDLAIQRLLEVLLRRDGYATRFARDGRSAIRAMAEGDYLALLVDISIWPSALERGSRRGIGFLHWLQKNHPGALQRVIALSALPDRELHGQLPPVRCFLHKPFGIDELREAVAKCAGAEPAYSVTGSRIQ
jgi:CheY-like chemotaxis protein